MADVLISNMTVIGKKTIFMATRGYIYTRANASILCTIYVCDIIITKICNDDVSLNIILHFTIEKS